MSKPILDEVRDILRRRHYSIRTEKRYCDWVKRYIKHFNIKTPSRTLHLGGGSPYPLLPGAGAQKTNQRELMEGEAVASRMVDL